MVIFIDGNEIDSGWLIAAGTVVALLVVLFLVFLGVVWHAASQVWHAASLASDWIEEERERQQDQSLSAD